MSTAAFPCPSIWHPRWFLSRTVRQATQLCKHVRKLVNSQRDLLAPKGVAEIAEAAGALGQAIRAQDHAKTVPAAMERLETVANKWLKSYPNPGMRENLEVLLVALAVAMGIRTFFLQPFKIPTGSMQPTLYGITDQNLVNQPEVEIPNRLVRFVEYWTKGVKYIHLVAESGGELRAADPTPTRFLLFNLKQRILVGNQWYTLWFPPEDLLRRAGLTLETGFMRNRVFQKGEDILKLRVVSGDHLFVDRFTYNFRPPRRGEIIVFQTAGINDPRVPQNQYYIKRLIGLPGETVSIDATGHVVINGRRLDASDPHFENLYGFWDDDRYIGHVHAGPYFQDPTDTYRVKPDHYVVFGDNTRNSLDSRYWGDFPQEVVIGRSYFVYWPISERFGWGHR